MSHPSKNQIYNIDKVNKKILLKPPPVHPKHEFQGPQNKYRDEDYEIYKLKRQQFYDAAKKYEDLNKTALFNNNSKLDMFCTDILRYYDECECNNVPRNLHCSEEEFNKTGLLVRKRIMRPIHKDNLDKVEICCLEPWFYRYLKLCKFIYAARTIIMKKRLLKNLAILRELNAESVAAYEAGHRKFENVSYAEIFEKFIQ